MKAERIIVFFLFSAFRGFQARQKYGPLLNSKTGQIDQETYLFIKDYAKRWKARTIFQVLLHYRAARYQDLVNLSQQVIFEHFFMKTEFQEKNSCFSISQIHLYNQAVVCGMKSINSCMLLEKVDPKEINPALLGPLRPAVNKLPFRLDEIPFFDTSYMCDPLSGHVPEPMDGGSEHESWDAPLRRSNNISSLILQSTQNCTIDEGPAPSDTPLERPQE